MSLQTTPSGEQRFVPKASIRTGVIVATATGIALLGIVFLAAFLLGQNNGDDGVEFPQAIAPSPTATPEAPVVIGAGSGTASACLGGPNTDITMLVRAQEKAPLTPQGAASFAAASFRWANRWPAPTPEEFDIAEEKIFAADATESVRELRGLYAEYEPDYSSEITDFATDGRYYVDRAEGDRAVVSLLYRKVTDPADNETSRFAQTVTLRATAAGWQLVDVGATVLHTPQELWDMGTPYDHLGMC